ncbi:MAG: M1 family metallopeptidase, partial [Caldilineaceae bacterium SB0665_bin_25]|nr:M1 family metallopeptidase [Caldilineaceae bacterium SB0665_bin_25]
MTKRKRGGGRRPQLRYVVLFAVALALSAVLAACDREANPTTEEPEVTVLAPTPSATVAPATFTPEPTAPPPTPTQVPQAVEEPPHFPTPDIDLTDYSIYGETLLEAFAEDAGRLPDAPHYFIQARLLPGEVPSLEGVQRVRITNQEETSLTELYFRLYPNLPAYGGAAEVSRALVDGKVATVGDLFDGTAVFIPLEGGLAPGATTDVTLWFRATLPTQV